MTNKAEQIDESGLKFNQLCIVVLTALAFIINNTWLVGFVAFVMLTGTAFPKFSLFKLIYATLLKKTGLIKPRIIQDKTAPHRFAGGLGGVFLSFSFVLLTVFKSFIAGWSLGIAVLLFAFINITANFCIGCFIYYQLYRLGFLPLMTESNK